MTQKNNILKHLLKGKPITPLQALSLYGIMRLSARILELKNDGFDIGSHTVKVKKRNNKWAEVKQYFLKG